MPWTRRPDRRHPSRMRQRLRRWRYDHSEGLRSLAIAAAVIGAALVLIVAMRLVV